MTRYAISDIHGCPRTLEALLDKIAFTRSDELFLLGDYVDRGPDSKGVLDKIMSLKKEGYSVVCLRGNHEQMLLDAMDKKVAGIFFGMYGDALLLENFGVRRSVDIPKPYISMMQDTIFYTETDGYILTHAGLNFKSADPLLDTYSMMWIRYWYGQISKEWLRGRIIVHGHTPTPRMEIERRLERLDAIPVLNIDAGCSSVLVKGYGALCAFDLDRRVLHFQENIEFD